MTLKSRKGDRCRDLRGSSDRLTWSMTEYSSFRWLPKHGKPSSVFEWLSQNFVKLIAWLPVYIAIVVTLIFLLQIYLVHGLL